MRLFRLFRIVWVGLRFGLDEFLLGHDRFRFAHMLVRGLLFWRPISQPRAVRLRLALEALGPIFVKFGQMLSTRRDLMPPDIADELAKLQDKVPPFASSAVLATLEKTYGKPASQVFVHFEEQPVASASVAQVHFAVLPDGREAAVKVLRPGIGNIISKDIALLEIGAWLLERLWSDGKRLRPREVVAEFEKHLHDELDLTREAANASQLRRNFLNSPLLVVPEVFWDFCSNDVMVMERMHGTPISQVDKLLEQGIDIPRLAQAGVEIFFTQVFRDGFSMPICTPATSWWRPTAAILRSISASWVRSTTSTSSIWRRISSPSSSAITARWRWRISNPAGRRRTPGWTNSRPPFAPCASRFSTSR